MKSLLQSTILLILLYKVALLPQDNSVENICRLCGDIVNQYCCRYYRNCCEFLTPSGCPLPSSPEARISCRKPITCRTNADCPMFKQCCDTSICGPTCMMDNFHGYRY